MLLTGVAIVALFGVAFVIVFWHRILALAVGAYARRLGFILTVDTFKITAATGVKICIQKGMLQDIRIGRVCLGLCTVNQDNRSFRYGLIPFIGRIRVRVFDVQLSLRFRKPAIQESSGEKMNSSVGATEEEPSVNKAAESVAFTEKGKRFKMSILTLFEMISFEVSNLKICTNEDYVDLLNMQHLKLSPSGMGHVLKFQNCTILPTRETKTHKHAGDPLAKFDGGQIKKEYLSVAAPSRWMPSRKMGTLLDTNTMKIVIDIDPVSSSLDLDRLTWLISSIKNNITKSSQDKSFRKIPAEGSSNPANPLKFPHLGHHICLPAEVSIRFSKIEVVSYMQPDLPVEFIMIGSSFSLKTARKEGEAGDLCVNCSWNSLKIKAMPENLQSPVFEVESSRSNILLDSLALNNKANNAIGGETDNVRGVEQTENSIVMVECKILLNNMHTRIGHHALAKQCMELLCSNLQTSRKKGFKADDYQENSTNNNPNRKMSFWGRIRNDMEKLQWKLIIRIGEGSSLQFISQKLDCIWTSSIHSASIKIDKEIQVQDGPKMDPGFDIRFEANKVYMMTSMPNGLPMSEVRNPQLDGGVLSASLVSFSWKKYCDEFDIVYPSDMGNLKMDGTNVADLSILVQNVNVALLPSFVVALTDVLEAAGTVKRVAKSLNPNNVSTDMSPLDVSTPRGKNNLNKLPNRISWEVGSLLVVAPWTETISEQFSYDELPNTIQGSTCFFIEKNEGFLCNRTKNLLANLNDMRAIYCEGLQAQKLPHDAGSVLKNRHTNFLSIQAASWAVKSFENGLKHSKNLVLDTPVVKLDFDAICCTIQAIREASVLMDLVRSSVKELKTCHHSEDSLTIIQGFHSSVGSKYRSREYNSQYSKPAEKEQNTKGMLSERWTDTSNTSFCFQAFNIDFQLPLTSDLEVTFSLTRFCGDSQSIDNQHQQFSLATECGDLRLKGVEVLHFDDMSIILIALSSKDSSFASEKKPLWPHSWDPDFDTSNKNSSKPNLQQKRSFFMEKWLGHHLDTLGRQELYERAGYGDWLKHINGIGRKQLPENIYSREFASFTAIFINGFKFSVPHDREPGQTLRRAQLHWKAMQHALNEKGSIKNMFKLSTNINSKANGKNTGTLERMFPMEVSFDASHLTMQFQHHPMERFMARNGESLQRWALKRHMWEEALDNIIFESTKNANHGSSPAKFGKLDDIASEEVAQLPKSPLSNSTLDDDVNDQNKNHEHDAFKTSERRALWATLMANISTDYKENIKSINREEYPDDILCIKIQHIGGVLISPLSFASNNSNIKGNILGQSFTDFITNLDPESSGVSFSRCRKLFLDFELENASVRLACAPKPLVECCSLAVSGPTAIAIQATASPATESRKIPLGMHRMISIDVALKGSRAPSKLYTDLQMNYDKLRVCFSPGLEPAFVVAGLAGKKLAPKDPDQSSIKLPLPWWDELRYLWRGRAVLKGSNFVFVLGTHHSPKVDVASERLLLTSKYLALTVNEGCYELDFDDIACTLFRVPTISSGLGGGARLVVPLLQAPSLEMLILVDWKLCNGRKPSQHYLFPKVPNLVKIQEPIIASEFYKTEGLNVSLNLKFQQKAICRRRNILPWSKEQQIDGDHDTDVKIKNPSAVIFLGDQQVSFIRAMVRTFKNTPAYIRSIVKRGTFFCRKHSRGTVKKGLPRLLQSLQLSVSADPFDLVHHTVQQGDPSSDVRLQSKYTKFEASWLFNQPLLSFLSLPQHVTRRQKPLNSRTLMEKFWLHFESVNVLNGQKTRRNLNDVSVNNNRDGDESEVTIPGVADEQNKAIAEALAFGLRRDLSTEDEESILRAEALLHHLIDNTTIEKREIVNNVIDAESITFKLKSLSDHGTEGEENIQNNGAPASPLTLSNPQRSMHVLLSGCRFIVDQESRNAVWGVISHLVAAFSSMPKSDPLHRTLTATPPSVFHSASPSPSGFASESSLARRETLNDLKRRLSSNAMSIRNSSQSSETGAESNELLNLLLNERETQADADAGQDSSSSTAEDDNKNIYGDEVSAELPLSTPLDDLHSTLKYEIEVINLQVMLLPPAASSASGRFLLAAHNGRLKGMKMLDYHNPLQITTLALQAVQAYVALTDIDPHVGLRWLQIDNSDGAFISPSESDPGALRRVFSPIQIDLRHSKRENSIVTTRRGATTVRSPQSASQLVTPGSSGTVTHGIKSDELFLKIPEIAAVMDGREFEVLAEVVSLLLSPGPAVETVTMEPKLLVESENELVEDARQLFALARQHACSLRQEAYLLLKMLYHAGELYDFCEDNISKSVRYRRMCDLGDKNFEVSYEDSQHNSNEPMLKTQDSIGRGKYRSHLLAKLEEVILTTDQANNNKKGKSKYSCLKLSDEQDLPSKPPRLSKYDIDTEGPQTANVQKLCVNKALVEWVLEEKEQAYHTYMHAMASLLSLKGEASKQLMLRSSSRILFKLDHVVWQLCTPEKQPFVQATLKRILFDWRRNRDHSGSAKFLIHRLDILDATGMLPEAPATAPGVILTVWNPDSTYEREPILRIVATMGIPTSTHIVFQHIDATLHPLSIHITESIAISCWDYFFPKEDSQSRQQVFVQSVGASGSRGKHPQDQSPRFSIGTDSSVTPKVLVSDRSGNPSQRTQNSGSKHKQNERSFSSFVMDSAALDDGKYTPTSVSGQGFEQIACVESEDDLVIGMPTLSYDSVKARAFSNSSKSSVRKRKMFLYVKLNRAHMRITYQGYPIGIKDRILVVNSYSCENLEGRWRDLLSDVKQKAILSAVWSGLGLQNRKIKELLEGAVPSKSASPPIAYRGNDPGGGPIGLLARIGLGGKSKRDQHAYTRGKNEEEMKAIQKKRALFGNQLFKSMNRNQHLIAPPFESSIEHTRNQPRTPNDYEINQNNPTPNINTDHHVGPSVGVERLEMDEDPDGKPIFGQSSSEENQTSPRKPIQKLDLDNPCLSENQLETSRHSDFAFSSNASPEYTNKSKLFASPLQAGLQVVSRAGAIISSATSGDGRHEKDATAKLLGKRVSNERKADQNNDRNIAVQLLGQSVQNNSRMNQKDK